MPRNPSRSSQGGDVEGETKIDVSWAVGDAIEVASASYDPGYEMKNSAKILPGGLKSHLIKGYCDYGRVVGEPDSAFDDWSDN